MGPVIEVKAVASFVSNVGEIMRTGIYNTNDMQGLVQMCAYVVLKSCNTVHFNIARVIFLNFLLNEEWCLSMVYESVVLLGFHLLEQC